MLLSSSWSHFIFMCWSICRRSFLWAIGSHHSIKRNSFCLLHFCLNYFYVCVLLLFRSDKMKKSSNVIRWSAWLRVCSAMIDLSFRLKLKRQLVLSLFILVMIDRFVIPMYTLTHKPSVRNKTLYSPYLENHRRYRKNLNRSFIILFELYFF